MVNKLNLVWFSNVGTEYTVEEIAGKKVVKFTELKRTFDWDNCSLQLAPSTSKKIRLFVRGHKNKYSEYNKRIVQATFLLVIDVNSISIPMENQYHIGTERRDLKSLHFKSDSRYVFQLDESYWIWEWKKNYSDIKESTVYTVYQQIISFIANLSHSEPQANNIISAILPHTDEDILPVIYQPAIDSLKNFVREIHCANSKLARKRNYIEVTIMFNNEQLRRHKVVNSLYEKFRLWFFGRKIDVETFHIRFSDTKYDFNYFTFEGIYSGDSKIEEDTIHGDTELPPPKRSISYYFMDQFHPVVFVNTSNHAFGEKDNNNCLWKWEYKPFEKKSPVIYGNKSRKEIDNQFTSIFVRISGFFRWKNQVNTL